MDKYIATLASIPDGYLHIAFSFAKDNSSPVVEPAHLLRALLHKNIGLIDFIENKLDSDYYYILDWADVKVSQCMKSPYPMKEPVLSESSRSVVKEALRIAKSYGNEEVDVKSLLSALVSPGFGFSADQLKTLPLSPYVIINYNTGGVSSSDSYVDVNINQQVESTYCVDILSNCHSYEVIGFEKEVRSMIESLSRKDRANIIICGESGVGKTSLIYGFLHRLADKSMPNSLVSLHPFELDLVAMSQGVSYKGEVEDRFSKIIGELSSFSQPLLIIENFHRVMDKQSLLHGILPMLKRSLSKNQIQIIVTSTIDGFTKDIENDKELRSLCEKIIISEPDENLAKDILSSKIPEYSGFHGVAVCDGLATDIVRLAKRYLPEKSLPSSSIDLLDRAMAAAKISGETSGTADGMKLDRDFIRNVLARITGLPIGSIQSEEREKLANAEEVIHRRVVGQSHAVRSVLDAVCESRSGLNKKGQPIGSFFFLGPTGTGKTELAKALAEFMFNDESSILRFDMSEYKEEHSVALLYGAPPGYVGYEEGGLLVNQIRQHPYSVVLFDEIEKAHRSVFDLFLQILDEGKLHDRLGRVGDFSNAVIIFTSNIGSEYIFNSFERKHIPSHDEMLEVMQGKFRPEFLARITEILPFSPITEEMIYKIFDIHIRNLVKSLDQQSIKLEIHESAKEYVTKVGFNTHYGARPVLGIIRKEIRRPLSKMIIAGDISEGDTVIMKHDPDNNEMVWEICN